MAKLSIKILSVLLVIILIVSIYFSMGSMVQMPEATNSSVFGRNVYQQNKVLGKTANPAYQITFPNDHAAHDQFDIEWWYLTANLKDESGDTYGLQWTLFRFTSPVPASSVGGAWDNNQIYMAHASIHSLTTHWFAEKFARGGVGNAGVQNQPFSLFIDNWLWKNIEGNADLMPASLEFTASNTDKLEDSQIQASFSLSQTGPFVLHGQNGYSVKSVSKHASHYYSAPFIQIEGTIDNIEGKTLAKPIRLTGHGWFDQEWTSQLLDNSTEGWDWLSLHLDDGSKIMAFRMRLKDQEDYITGSYITDMGQQLTLEPNDLSLQPLSKTTLANRALPLDWRLTIPNRNIDITVSTVKDAQWNDALIPYYEGMVSVAGSHSGTGYLELTGY